MIHPRFIGEISHYLLKVMPPNTIEEDENKLLNDDYECNTDLYSYILADVGGDIIFVTSLIQESKNTFELKISPVFLIDKFSCFVNSFGNYPGGYDTFDLLDLINESSKIIEVIADLGKNDSRVFQWLSEMALDAVLQELCLVAIRCLPKSSSAAQEVVGSLVKAARENDLDDMDAIGSQIGFPVPSPRRVALEVLMNYYPDHPLTVEVFRDRTVNDSSKEIREWAREQAKKLESKNSVI